MVKSHLTDLIPNNFNQLYSNKTIKNPINLSCMKNLNDFLTLICKPSPKTSSNPTELAAIFAKNKSFFIIHLVLVLLDVITLPFLGCASLPNQLRFGASVTMMFVFLVFGRSHRQICQVYNAIAVNILGITMHYDKEGIYQNLPISYGIPIVVFSTTQNLGLTCLSSFTQSTVVLMTFKKNLIEAVSFSDPVEFAENFSNHFLAISISLQVIVLVVVYNLKKKTTQLAEATKRAEEALEQQKTFVYSFSHEMRNPMNSLLGNLDLALMSSQITPELREMIGTAKICAVLLLNLINTVLDAGKLGLGKLEVSPVSTRVHDVFQKAWTISHDIITRKGLASHLKISRQVPARLLLDSHRLNQVLMNLIGNATKFTESGAILLSINWLGEENVSDKSFEPIPYDDEGEGVFEKNYNLYAIKRRGKSEVSQTNQSLILSGAVKEFSLEGVFQPVDEVKGVLKIIIKDTGCGMNEEELKKLFQKFSQVGRVTTKRQIGTGLGLFISKEIIEKMGGQIRAYSKPNVGSTFIVCIPTTALPIQSEQHIDINDHLIPKLKSKKFTTLVADDSAFNVSLVCNFYSKIGVEVLATANNGQVAYNKYLEIVKNNGPNIDIITLDIDMPVMDGKQVCEKIRKYERENNRKKSIIILISGNYEEEALHNLLSKDNENRPDCFLKKPLVFEELCWTLYKYGCFIKDRRN